METTPRSEPRRVQQRRTRGWRKPENTVSVARPGRFGNPFAVSKTYGGIEGTSAEVTIRDRAHAVEHFSRWLSVTAGGMLLARMAREQLVGRNLMCFCPLDQPCHADVLLKIANGEDHA